MSTTAPRGLGRGLGELFQRTEPRHPTPSTPPTHSVEATSPTDSTHTLEPTHSTHSVAPTPPTHSVEAKSPTDSTHSMAPARGMSFGDGSDPMAPPAAFVESVELVPVPEGSSYREVAVDDIVPNPKQPRTVFDEEALQELADSVSEIGLLQPIVVRPLEQEPRERFELVMGERRWRAAQRAGLALIPAIVRRTEDHDLLRDALLENLHRAQLNPLEEAAAYQQMLDDFGCTQDELASRIKRSRPQISNTIRLLRLPPTVQRRVAAGVLSAGHARALLAVSDSLGQERLAQRVVAEGLSVRSTEEMVALEGGQATVPRPRRRPAPSSMPEADELAASLSDRLETRVRVEVGSSRGRIVIEAAGWDDLQRIAAAIGGGSAGHGQ